MTRRLTGDGDYISLASGDGDYIILSWPEHLALQGLNRLAKLRRIHLPQPFLNPSPHLCPNDGAIVIRSWDRLTIRLVVRSNADQADLGQHRRRHNAQLRQSAHDRLLVHARGLQDRATTT